MNKKITNTLTYTQTYNVTYNGNGGLWNEQETWSNTATYGEDYYIEPNFFNRAGYTFVGWSENPNTTDDAWQGWDGQYWTWTYERDVTLYAIWTPNIYTITYSKGDYGTGDDIPAGKQIYGEAFTLTSEVYSRTGYIQAGWSTSDGGEYVYGIGQSFEAGKGFSSDYTLYPYWTTIAYTVSYDANGGSGAPNNQIFAYGVSSALSSTIPTRIGYKFLGWSTDQSATSALYFAGDTIAVTSNTVLYAVWQLEETVCIHNGTTWGNYMVYIYNGEEFKMYTPYIYNGTSWDRY